VSVQITHLTSGTTEPAKKLACDKMAASDDVRDSAVRHLAFIVYLCLNLLFTGSDLIFDPGNMSTDVNFAQCLPKFNLCGHLCV